jgi:hypothetical protein
MMHLIRILAGLGCLTALAGAATHSAWSSPIPWDSGVGIEGTSFNGPAAALGLSVLPNPASTFHAVCFQVQGKLGARAVVEILGVNGKIIQTLSLTGQSGNTVSWKPAGFNGKSLASGVYLARLKSGSTVIEQKFMLLK